MRGRLDSTHPLRCSRHQSQALFPAGPVRNNLRNQLKSLGSESDILPGALHNSGGD